jgi:hypothetical protein
MADDLEHLAVVVDDVELARVVLTERADQQVGVE